MRNCPNCGTKNREGTLFCEECGQDLRERNLTVPTRQLEELPRDLASRATWGTASFGHQSHVIVHIRDASEPVTLQLQDRTIVGRKDDTSVRQPDFDLTPFGALEKGVSRIHAIIERSDDTLTLVDMGSSNGTHLNGQRLIPDQPRVLRDGDEVRFGKLVAHIYFK
ncbi:MAG: FHA domain-containing protein [Chitinophagaceae bacterium]|nr:FHA domain-containing protein [Anaerolineae bacterium]